jgi:hypothetical protein
VKDQVMAAQKNNRALKTQLNSKLSKNWLGQRQSVELPKASKSLKAIEPELLSRRFMCIEDYHHYADWKAEMEKTYDQFNLL